MIEALFLTVVVVFFFLDSSFDTGSGRNDSVFVGSPASFVCPVDGNPEPSITWYKESGIRSNVNVSSPGKNLTFPKANSEDSGCYTCPARNFLGTKNITQCLTVGEFLAVL